MTYATLNGKASVYPWLSGLLQSERVPLVFRDPADLDALTLTDEVSYVAALDRLTREQQKRWAPITRNETGFNQRKLKFCLRSLEGGPSRPMP